MCEGRGLVTAHKPGAGDGAGQFMVSEGDRVILPKETSLEYNLTSTQQNPVTFSTS